VFGVTADVTGQCDVVIFLNPMRRMFALLALAATCIGFLSPLIAAAQLSPIHACCLRTGKHHCHEFSTPSAEYTFRAKHDRCPFSAPLTLSTFQGLHATRFHFRLHWRSSIVAQSAFERGYPITTREWSTRGPPTVLL
jgi:hypothetical protein